MMISSSFPIPINEKRLHLCGSENRPLCIDNCSGSFILKGFSPGHILNLDPFENRPLCIDNCSGSFILKGFSPGHIINSDPFEGMISQVENMREGIWQYDKKKKVTKRPYSNIIEVRYQIKIPSRQSCDYFLR